MGLALAQVKFSIPYPNAAVLSALVVRFDKVAEDSKGLFNVQADSSLLGMAVLHHDARKLATIKGRCICWTHLPFPEPPCLLLGRSSERAAVQIRQQAVKQVCFQAGFQTRGFAADRSSQ